MTSILVLHSTVSEQAPPDEQDTLVQAREVAAALERLGFRTRLMAFELNLVAMRDRILKAAPELVFNLVETAAGSGRFIHLAPTLLDHLGLPYTGAGAEALLLTSNKVLAKQWLGSVGIPTPPGFTLTQCRAGEAELGMPLLIKSVWEHASVGLFEDSLITPADRGELVEALQRQAGLGAGEVFAERFIDGREFNLALLGDNRDPLVLPPAEILFADFPDGKPRIVDYRAKWDASSFEYQHTPRSFRIRREDRKLLETLTDLARRCWRLFDLRGYARVDFRVDRNGRPWVLEINANPCLAADAGFMAAAAQAGLDSDQVVRRILRAAPASERCPAFRLEPTPPYDSSASSAPEAAASVIGNRRSLFSTRRLAVPDDIEKVRRLVEATGFFSPEEIAIAQELVQERLRLGSASGYHFLFWDRADTLVGYTCHGPIAGTQSGYDLYWIAVAPEFQGQGIGRRLLESTEQIIWEQGGGAIYVETSGRGQYKATRRFYLRMGYRLEAVLKNFYAPRDHQCILVKTRPPTAH